METTDIKPITHQSLASGYKRCKGKRTLTTWKEYLLY